MLFLAMRLQASTEKSDVTRESHALIVLLYRPLKSLIGERIFMVLKIEKIRNGMCPPFFTAKLCICAVLWDALFAMDTMENSFFFPKLQALKR